MRIAVVGTPKCDDEAETLMVSYRGPLLGFVLPLVNGDRGAAEDVVQETMLRAWKHRADLVPDRAGSWLRTVARNIAISTYHRRRRARPHEVPLNEDAMHSADDALDHVLDSWQVAAALRTLERDHQIVIVELFYQRRSVAELAALLSIPEGTVRSRCFYALRALHKALAARGVVRS